MTKYKSVTAFAPASVANVGCGYDIMGYAVDGIGDKVTISLNPDADNSKVILTGEYGHLTPSEREKHAFGQRNGKQCLKLSSSGICYKLFTGQPFKHS